ncbi:protein MAIN-LIKE 2-like [Glycine soja]|uniref:protein MAIN-LIKE 2-like n=1 Tax=Glycine soja TaxID=3848 RepID=UPI0010388A52|nr:protein MAIN-LIKE 2-like [Glycine soja]
MVRIRGLGRALGRIIGRALGREDSHDSDDAPQRRRPTASARRQQGVVTVAEDEPVVPVDDPVVAADKPMVAANVHDTGADEPEGFPGGLSDPSVLTKYVEHVAASVWSEEEQPELKLSFHGRKVQKLGRPVPAIEGETSSFYLPVGEVTITLDDVTSLRHLPIAGAFHTFQPLHIDEAVLMLVDLLLVLGEAARAKTTHCHGPYVRPSWLRDIYQRKCQARHWTAAARAYLLHLLGCILFANKSATHVHVVFLDALRDLSQIGMFALGATALVHMYDHLNDACISTNRQLTGYIILLQCWIYEHFSSVAECIADPNYDEVSPRACWWIATKAIVKTKSTATYRQCLDQLRIPDVYWMPYGKHRPEACHAIVERLERLLNLRIVTEGTETYEVMEDCIRIVRSRHRQRTNQ